MKKAAKLFAVLTVSALCAVLFVGCGTTVDTASSAVSQAASSASSAAAAASDAVSSSAEAISDAVADIDVLEAAVTAIEVVNPVSNPRVIDDFSLENEMGLTKDNIIAYKGDVTNDQADCSLVFVAQVKDGTADAVVEELKAYQSTMTGNLYAEFADKVAKAEEARILAKGNFVMMVIAGVNGPDYSAIDDAISSAFAG